jgi:hypothetical protein
VEKLRHEQPEVFTELVLSNLTRLIDLPGSEFSELLGEEAPPKTPTGSSGGGFFRSFNFLKRKGQTLPGSCPLVPAQKTSSAEKYCYSDGSLWSKATENNTRLQQNEVWIICF